MGYHPFRVYPSAIEESLSATYPCNRINNRPEGRPKAHPGLFFGHFGGPPNGDGQTKQPTSNGRVDKRSASTIFR